MPDQKFTTDHEREAYGLGVDHTVHSARAAAEGRAMNSDEQRADRWIRLERAAAKREAGLS
jgi:hypothetical protein